MLQRSVDCTIREDQAKEREERDWLTRIVHMYRLEYRQRCDGTAQREDGDAPKLCGLHYTRRLS